MAKQKSIPENISADLLYASDNTCCFCHKPHEPIQIHHIDEDAANNNPDNLAVLCLSCHDKTQISGGFGRKFGKNIVTKYRNEWHSEVSRLREAAFQNRLKLKTDSNSIFKNKDEYGLSDVVSIYIISKIDLYIDSIECYRHEKELISTVDMVNFNYYISDRLVDILRDISQFCKEESFKSSEIIKIEEGKDYFHSLASISYEWSRFSNNGEGTIQNILIGASANEILRSFTISLMVSLFPLHGNAEQINKVIQRFRSV